MSFLGKVVSALNPLKNPPPIIAVPKAIIEHISKPSEEEVAGKELQKTVDKADIKGGDAARSRLQLQEAAQKAPEEYFTSQKQNATNPNEDVTGADNSNCGPTSLLMIAEAFGKVDVTPAQADAAIEKVRTAMDASKEQTEYTNFDQLVEGGRNLGLKPEKIKDASTDDVREELAKGHKLIAHVDPNYSGNQAQHFVVVTGIEGDQVHVSDPLDGSPRTMPISEFEAGTKQGAGVISFAP